jgi:chloramphenicol-sensitive protein RarD
MNKSKYYVAGISAFVIWGFFSLVLKPLAGYASLDILFYRVFFSAAVMLVISFVFRIHMAKANLAVWKGLSPNQKKILGAQAIGGGALLTANWFFFIYVMNHISVRSASLAYIACPILTTALAFLFLKEKLSRLQWFAIGLSVISFVILSFSNVVEVIFSLIVALSYAIYLVAQPKRRDIDKFLLLTIQISCSALLLLPFYPVYHTCVPAAFSFYLYIMIIGLFFTILPLFLNLYALKGLRSSALGMFLFINPLVNFAVALLYYQERMTPIQITGYLLIVVSVILFNIKDKR